MNLLEAYAKRIAVSESVYGKQHNGEKMSNHKKLTVAKCLENEENIIIVEDILKNGVPKKLSKESYETIWLVIDHASLEKQEKYLPDQQSRGRQKQENHQNVCSINNAMADRLQIY